MDKIRFLEEKKLAKTLEAEHEKGTAAKPKDMAFEKSPVTNPVASAFLKFVHSKHKFNIKDL